LALKQVDEIIQLFGLKNLEVITYNTTGDMDKKTPLPEMEDTNFFTDIIDRALIMDDIDCAVHSAKDLPDKLSAGLKIAVLTEAIDLSDALVSKNDLKLNELPKGARIGASSIRRKEQLKKFRSDFHPVDIRGNVDDRLKKFELSELDGLIVAASALIRLGLENRIAERLPIEIFKPHPLQGSLAVVVRKDDYETEKIFKK